MTAANLHTVTLTEGDLVFNADLKVKQVRAMASSDGDLGKVIDVLRSVVVSWPHDGDPTTEDAWDELTMPQFSEAAEGLTEALGKVLSE